VIAPSEDINAILVSRETTPLSTGAKLIDLMRRPNIGYEALTPIDKDRPVLPALVLEQVEVEIKYEGYIKRQLADIAEMRRLEKRLIPADTDYSTITGLRKEAQEKLSKVRPHNIGQASRISGVSPADISVLIVYTNK
ncbi:MAG: tRNA uridine-5-carboxymethylaminomethyl(34) synthesis enzyme MnmG, partial [Elusimicrobiaceae bacterium]|nr:tRNA uridine-5-carboxymethylaminomethyl(34) synthesis enzyme MnmG [Elusimicrobiaceae bacterium]